MRESYLAEFPGYYKTADAGFKDEDGYLFVMGRTDDIINVAGHRLSTGGMEEVLASHPDVAECAVLGIKDELKGEVPCGFIVLKSGVNRPPTEIEKECIALVRDKIGPVAAFKLAITVGRLPKTRSGKILRGTMKKIADGETWTMPATIDDPGGAGRDRRRAEAKGSRRIAVELDRRRMTKKRLALVLPAAVILLAGAVLVVPVVFGRHRTFVLCRHFSGAVSLDDQLGRQGCFREMLGRDCRSGHLAAPAELCVPGDASVRQRGGAVGRSNQGAL